MRENGADNDRKRAHGGDDDRLDEGISWTIDQERFERYLCLLNSPAKLHSSPRIITVVELSAAFYELSRG